MILIVAITINIFSLIFIIIYSIIDMDDFHTMTHTNTMLLFWISVAWVRNVSPKVAEGSLRWRSGPNHSNWYVQADSGMHVHMPKVLNIVLWAAFKNNSIKINITQAIKVSQWKLNNEHSTSASQTQIAKEHLSWMVGMHWGAVIDFLILAYRKGLFFFASLSPQSQQRLFVFLFGHD